MTTLNTSLITDMGSKPLPQKREFASDEERLKTAKEYSKMFFGNFLKQMFKSTDQSSLWGDSHAREMLHPVWIDAIADASVGKTGFEKYIYKALGGKNYPQEIVIKTQGGGKLNVTA